MRGSVYILLFIYLFLEGESGGASGAVAAALRNVCIAANDEQYWNDLVLARAWALSREHVNNGGALSEACSVVANDTWGSENVGDPLYSPAILRVGVSRNAMFERGMKRWEKIKKKEQEDNA